MGRTRRRRRDRLRLADLHGQRIREVQGLHGRKLQTLVRRCLENKVAAGFTTSASQSGDKLNTLLQLMVFANQHAMIWVGLDLMPGNNNSKGSVDDLNRLGSFSGAMAQANADQGAEAMRESDLKTAARLGARVAETALALQRGRA